MSILIADDHPLMRKGMRDVLAEELGLRDIVEAGDGRTAYDLLVSEQFELAVVDVSMPGKNGLDLIKDVLAVRPTVPFLAVSIYPEHKLAERAYRCGAKGYLCKTRSLPEFVEAARTILKGDVYVNPEFAQTLVEKLREPREKTGLELLTDREIGVLRLYAQGKTLKHIGDELGISIKTVSTHKRKIQEKLALRSNADLIAFAIAQGLGSRGKCSESYIKSEYS